MAVGKVFHKGDNAGVFNEYGGNFGIYGPKPVERMNYDPEWFNKPKGTSTDWGAYPENEELMPDYKSTEWAVAKLKEKHDKPFFMAVGLVRPHVPWHVPQEWFDLFPVDKIVTPPYNPDDMDDISAVAKKITEFLPAPDMQWVLDNNKWEEIVQAYLACVAFMDHNVGKLLNALQESDYGDNTVIVFFGDNGYDLGQKGRFAKQSLWRTSTHVPLIISAPGYIQNQVCTANVGLIDIYPTLVDICNLKPNPDNEGRSLKPLLKNPEKEWEYITYSTYGRNNHTLYWKNMHYIRYYNGDEELYDLNQDINEWNNLIVTDSRNEEILHFFREELPRKNEVNVNDIK